MLALGGLMRMDGDAVRRALQLLPVPICPDVADHPEVEQYCLRPPASELSRL